ncbi:hypothetical protein D3C71_1222090 [compost metagenome]
MVDHKVHNQLHATAVKTSKQFLPIGERSEIIHNTLIITDIITVIVIRRLVHWAQPHHVDTKMI